MQQRIFISLSNSPEQNCGVLNHKGHHWPRNIRQSIQQGQIQCRPHSQSVRGMQFGVWCPRPQKGQGLRDTVEAGLQQEGDLGKTAVPVDTDTWWGSLAISLMSQGRLASLTLSTASAHNSGLHSTSKPSMILLP